MGVTVEAEQDQNRKNSRWPAPHCAVRCDAHHRETIRNFPVVAEKSCALSCIEHAVGVMREFPGNPPFKWRRKSKRDATPQFPESKQPFCARHRQTRMAPEFSRRALLSGGFRLLLLVLEQVGFASRTSRCGAVVATRGRAGRCCTMRVAAARTAVAVSLGRGHAGRAKEDCRYANQVKYFHCQSPKSTHRARFGIRLPPSRLMTDGPASTRQPTG